MRPTELRRGSKGTTLIYAFDDLSLGFLAPEGSPTPWEVELRLRGMVA
jgi:hypothetical protein